MFERSLREIHVNLEKRVKFPAKANPFMSEKLKFGRPRKYFTEKERKKAVERSATLSQDRIFGTNFVTSAAFYRALLKHGLDRQSAKKLAFISLPKYHVGHLNVQHKEIAIGFADKKALSKLVEKLPPKFMIPKQKYFTNEEKHEAQKASKKRWRSSERAKEIMKRANKKWFLSQKGRSWDRKRRDYRKARAVGDAAAVHQALIELGVSPEKAQAITFKLVPTAPSGSVLISKRQKLIVTALLTTPETHRIMKKKQS